MAYSKKNHTQGFLIFFFISAKSAASETSEGSLNTSPTPGGAITCEKKEKKITVSVALTIADTWRNCPMDDESNRETEYPRSFDIHGTVYKSQIVYLSFSL